ncbi:hypothetical protein CU048_05800 [Beijerinckiaceae bacterium]|nr:hypothetical protein CU048_05800 [Beijerinckiaceae bacterium]
MRYVSLLAATSVAAILSSILVPTSTETAVANGDTRTLNLYHSHTGESIQATFRVNGSYDPAALEKLNYFLRDWRNNDRIRMDPRLFDVVWEAYRTAGATQPIVIISSYRSPATNAMLRARSHAVAEHSQHMLGKAMDTTMPGMPMERIREIGMRLQRGGVGWYPSSNFVHLDVGNVRAWPRMSYDQLARLFPDGKTVHLASNGRSLPRYTEARAEIASRGGVMSDVPQSASSGGNLFAWLFGNKHDEDDDADARAQARTPSSRHGGTEVAAVRTENVSLTKNVARVETSSAAADRTVVADLGSTPNAIDTRVAMERDRTERQDRDGATPNPLKDKMDKRWAELVPLPPSRPALPGDRPALAFADVPTPPARPEQLNRVAAVETAQIAKALSRNDALSGPASATLARAANLPVVITDGPKDRPSAPNRVLAFASEGRIQDVREAAPSPTPTETADKPLTTSAIVSARLSRTSLRGVSSEVSAVASPAQPILGQPVTGLRQAARITPDLLSNVPSTEFVSAFGVAASDLDTKHFTGAAAKPLALAQGFVRITDASAPIRRY